MGHTALHIACIFGYSDIVELLIEHHARVNVKDVTGKTPLYYATKNNDYETVLVINIIIFFNFFLDTFQK